MEELRVYTHSSVGNVPFIVYWLLLVLLFVGSVLFLWRKGLKPGLRASAVLLLVEWMFLIFGTAVLFREAGSERNYSLIPFLSYFNIAENSYLLEVAMINLLNLLLFVPIGLLAGFGFQDLTWKKVAHIGFCFSVLIELLQFTLKKGLCEVDDVIHNVVGCVIGYGICQVVILLSKPAINKK